MSLKLRLSRAGAKKVPYYHFVVANSRSPRDGRYLEKVGTYNPMLPKDDPKRVIVNEERIKHWLGVGAIPSDRVARLLSTFGLTQSPKVAEQTKKSQPRPKTVERNKAFEEKAKAQAEAKAKATEEGAAAG